MTKKELSKLIKNKATSIDICVYAGNMSINILVPDEENKRRMTIAKIESVTNIRNAILTLINKGKFSITSLGKGNKYPRVKLDESSSITK